MNKTIDKIKKEQTKIFLDSMREVVLLEYLAQKQIRTAEKSLRILDKISKEEKRV